MFCKTLRLGFKPTAEPLIDSCTVLGQRTVRPDETIQVTTNVIRQGNPTDSVETTVVWQANGTEVDRETKGVGRDETFTARFTPADAGIQSGDMQIAAKMVSGFSSPGCSACGSTTQTGFSFR